MSLELDPPIIQGDSFLTLFNRRSIGFELPYTESYQVPANATVRLREAPLKESPSTVIIPGYAEDPLGPPVVNQFTVDYANGFIAFNAANIGATISISYKGRGSIILAQDINLITSPLVPFYNKLNTIVPDAPATPNFTFPDNVTVMGDLFVSGDALARETIVATASQTVFNLSFTIVSNNLLVFKQGLLATEGGSNDYTITGASQVTFNSGRPSGEIENFIRIG